MQPDLLASVNIPAADAELAHGVVAAAEATAKAAAEAALLNAISTMDKATSKGVYHKNTTSRKASRLTKAVNAMA